MRITRGSGNVFLDVGFPADEAQNLSLRSALMSRIERYVRSSGLTQKECAARMGVTQPRLNDLLRAKMPGLMAGVGWGAATIQRAPKGVEVIRLRCNNPATKRRACAACNTRSRV